MPPDYLHDPFFAQAVRSVVTPLLRGTASAAVKRASDTLPLVRFGRGEVLTIDDESGTADLKMDGDDANSVPTEAIVVAPAPVPGQRATVLYGPGGEAYLLGTVGGVRLLLPDTGAISVKGDEHGLQIGDSDDPNVAFDSSRIQARNGNSSTPTVDVLNLNPFGGIVRLGTGLAVGSALPSLTGAFLGHSALLQPDGDGWSYRFGSDYSHRANIGPAADVSSFAVIYDADKSGLGSQLLVVTRAAGQTSLRLPPGVAGISGTALGITGTGTVGTIPSSARYKTQIRTADPDAFLDGVCRLRPVRYRYRLHDGVPDEDVDTHIAPRVGLVAEEVAPLFPEAVFRNADGEPESIDSAAMIGVLAGAVKALTATVDAQASEIAALRAEVSELATRTPFAIGGPS